MRNKLGRPHPEWWPACSQVEGITLDILADALGKAQHARRQVLKAMAQCSPPPAATLSPLAPRILKFTIPNDKISAMVGPGGKVIKAIQQSTNCTVQVSTHLACPVACSRAVSVAPGRAPVKVSQSEGVQDSGRS